MIVFSLTLFLFSSFTFFYKIRISKKPWTPRSTTWWVCLFKQCQCSCSRCIDILCWLGGCTRCPSRAVLRCLVRRELGWALCQRDSTGGSTYMLPLPFSCLFSWNLQGLFPCEMCFKLPSRCEERWADNTGRSAASMVIHGSSGNDAKARLLFSAFSAMGTFRFFQGDPFFLPDS